MKFSKYFLWLSFPLSLPALIYCATAKCSPLTLIQNSSETLIETYSTTDFTIEKYKSKELQVDVKVEIYGNGPKRTYAIYANNNLEKRPLIIFLHGWDGMNPNKYASMIDHFARRGAVILYPVYQENNKTSPQVITEEAALSLKNALQELRKEKSNLIDTDKTIYYGFSMGATMALSLSTSYTKYDLPPAQALVLASPGDAHHVTKGKDATSIASSDEKKLQAIPTVLMTSVEDKFIGVPTAKKYWESLCATENKSLILWPSSNHKKYSFKSGHAAPWGEDIRYNFPDINTSKDFPKLIPYKADFHKSDTLNMLDFHGQWKVMTILFDWITESIQKERAFSTLFKNNSLITDLGNYPDGSSYPKAEIHTKCQAK